jgi:predicted ATPase/DNA-binding CsgD family transcriptional regulator
MTWAPWREAEGLPGELTSFVGRRQVATEVKRALSQSRLVTLVGVGGVGKSRLAVHVAREVRRSHPDGICLVDLAEVPRSESVVPAVAAALGLTDRADTDGELVLAEYLARKRFLLLVDNCEHVLSGCGGLVTSLLSAAPGLRVLATSREPLGIDTECVYAVPPLSVPARDGGPPGGPARAFEAVALFEERASAVVPGFTVTRENEASVVRLCQALDGLPLALELAAVRVRVLSVEQILARLEDRFGLLSAGSRAALPRHQTLRAAVDWSYDLCTEAERLVWGRCSVFTGEFDLDAADDVCGGDGLTVDDVPAGIAGLVDKSVLGKVEHGIFVRYLMPETMRQYGRERLMEAGGLDLVRRRHRDYYLRLAENGDADSRGPRQCVLAKRLRAARSNLIAALDYCLSTPGEEKTGLRLASALWFYWLVCGFARDGRHRLERAVAAAPEPTAERARALWVDGWISHFQGDAEHALAAMIESRNFVKHGTESGLSGTDESFVYSHDAAARLYAEELAEHRGSGVWTLPALMVFVAAAENLIEMGRPQEAVELAEEGEALCDALDESWVLSWIRWNLAVARWAQGDLGKTGELLREALRGKRDLDDRLGIPFCVELLAGLAVATGDARRAAMLYGAVENMWRPVGRPPHIDQTPLGPRAHAIEDTRVALGSRAFETAFEDGAGLSRSEAIAYALGEKTGAAEPGRNRPAAANPVLTKRERQVAELVATGKSNREIAAGLVISQRTAESHIEHIMSKLGFTSRTQITAWLAEGRQRRA